MIQGYLPKADSLFFISWAAKTTAQKNSPGDMPGDALIETLLYEGKNYVLRIKPRINEITASTIKTCIKPPALYTKKPNNQPITRITAIKYNILLMVNNFRLHNM
jgi:hypothetical protein